MHNDDWSFSTHKLPILRFLVILGIFGDFCGHRLCHIHSAVEKRTVEQHFCMFEGNNVCKCVKMLNIVERKFINMLG